MKHYGDITELKGYMLPEVDVVTGGSPCQDLSVAGKRAGLDGARSGLFMEQIRVIKEMRENDQLINDTEGADIKPRFMVWENVPGAFSSNKGEDFRAVLEETAKVCDETTTIPEPHKGKWHNSGAIMGDGWSIAWRVFDAQFWGVPQRRRRIYLVADFGGHTAPEILFKRDGLPGYLAPSRIAGQGTTADSEGSFIEAGGFDGYNGDLTGDVSSTLGVNCGMSTGRNGVVATVDKTFGVVSKGNGDAFIGVDRGCYTPWDVQSRQIFSEHGVWPTLYAGEGGGRGYVARGFDKEKPGGLDETEPIAVATQQGGAEISDNGICPTVTAAAGMSGNNQPWICSKPTISIEMGALERDQGNRMWEEVAPTMRAAVNDNSPCHILEPFVKSRRAKFQGDFETWVEGKVNPTLNNFDLGDIRTTTAVVEKDVFEWHNQDSRVTGPIDTACTLNTNAGGREGHLVMDAPAYHAVVEDIPFTQNQRNEVRILGDKSGALCRPATKQQTCVLQGSMIGRKEENGPQGDGVNEEVCFTLNTIDRHAVNEPPSIAPNTAYGVVSKGNGDAFLSEERHMSLGCGGGQAGQGYPCVLAIENHPQDSRVTIDDSGTVQTLTSSMGTGGGNVPMTMQMRSGKEVVGAINCMHDQQAVMSLETYHCENHEEVASTLKARDWKDPQCVNQQSVRRLTPLECERLQGFPDGWTDIQDLPKDLNFWRKVWDTFQNISGKKPKTDKAILTWLKNPTSDSGRYKALGNSVALPNTYFVLYGIAEQLGFKGTLGSLFDGIGGFPICWESICGKGTALWASEIEPFPIAVTKHHFTEED